MKRNRHAGVFVGLAIVLVASMVFASTRTGPIQRIRINAGTTAARVSIFMGTPTDGPNNGWFAYENASTGLGLVRTSGLLAAYESGQPVTIVGTGTCDTFGVERINFIDLL